MNRVWIVWMLGLSSQQQNIVSRLGGHLETYEVHPGQMVKKGDPIARIRSLELSKMSASFLALQKENAAAASQLANIRTLHKKGLASKADLNEAKIKSAQVQSKLQSIASQLRSLGIDPKTLTDPIDTLTIRAHAPGRVEALLVKLHTNVSPSTPLVSLVQNRGYYAIAYLSPKEALRAPHDIKGMLLLPSENLSCSFVQLAPRVDPATQRAQMLFRIKAPHKPLLLDMFTEMEISLPPYHKAVTVKKSALTLFMGEWVVFVPQKKEPEEEAHHETKSDHEAHEHHEALFVPQVVLPKAYFGDLVEVEGLKAGAEYVGEGGYFVKSMLLKSELGGHGH